MKQPCIIGLDIGGTHSRIGAVSMDGKMIHFELTRSAALSEGPAETAIADLAAFIRAYIDRHPDLDVRAISVAFPATLSKTREVLHSATNFGKNAKCRYDGMNIPQGLSQFFSVPVFLGKDSDFILLSDIFALGLDTPDMITGIYFGTGIGSSFFYHGETIYGSDGVAGEICHLPISDNRRLCTCGARQGCSETVASGWRLEELRREHFPDTPISEVFSRHADTPPLITFVFDIARVIALTGNLLNSAYTVVGGGILQMKDFPKQALEQQVLQLLRHPYPRDTFRLLFSPSGQDAGILGAAQYAFRTAAQRGIVL